MEQEIVNLLQRLGIHKTMLGFRYLKKALLLCLQDENYMFCYTRLFSEVAAYYNTTAGNVDHCIRWAIEKCYYQGNPQLLEDIAGYEINRRPPNSEFIEILFHHLERTLSVAALS